MKDTYISILGREEDYGLFDVIGKEQRGKEEVLTLDAELRSKRAQEHQVAKEG